MVLQLNAPMMQAMDSPAFTKPSIFSFFFLSITKSFTGYRDVRAAAFVGIDCGTLWYGEVQVSAASFFRYSSAIIRIATARVISLDAPATSPFTPPNKRLEIPRRTNGQMTIAAKAPAIFGYGSGKSRSGKQRISEKTGKYGRENWWR